MPPFTNSCCSPAWPHTPLAAGSGENPLQAAGLLLCQSFGEGLGGTMSLAVFKGIPPHITECIIPPMAISWLFLHSYKGVCHGLKDLTPALSNPFNCFCTKIAREDLGSCRCCRLRRRKHRTRSICPRARRGPQLSAHGKVTAKGAIKARVQS